jgi:ABC-type phosphate transport system permease subunit
MLRDGMCRRYHAAIVGTFYLAIGTAIFSVPLGGRLVFSIAEYA